MQRPGGPSRNSTIRAQPEDIQPNEAVKRQRQNQPPVIKSTAPHRYKHPWKYKRDWRGSFNYRGRGGGHKQMSALQHRRRAHDHDSMKQDDLYVGSSCGQNFSGGSHHPVSPSSYSPARTVLTQPAPDPTQTVPPLTPQASPRSDIIQRSSLFSPAPTSSSPTAVPSHGALSHSLDTPVPRGNLAREALVVVKEETKDNIILHPSPPHLAAQSTIKPENRTPSPIPLRRLVTTSCNRYLLPDNCKKTNPDYLKHRREFASKECKILHRFGLLIENLFFRDDGMVVHWTSPVPVWSDTYLPETKSCAKKADTIYIDFVSDDEPEPSSPPKPPSSKRTPRASRPDSSPAAPPSDTTSPESQQSRLMGDISSGLSPAPALPRRRLPSVRKTPKPPQTISPSRNSAGQSAQEEGEGSLAAPINNQLPPSIVRKVWSEKELVNVEPLAIQFLQRYIRTFNVSTPTLLQAYALNALFSFRLVNSTCDPRSLGFSSGFFASHVRSDIAKALSQLPFKFFSTNVSRPLDVHYDVVSLGEDAGGGILLVTYGEVVRVASQAAPAEKRRDVFHVTQSFVLQAADHGVDVHWPLFIVAHQMVLKPLIPRAE